ncbi:sushi, von Willebrand factor type A, EGF and pentraxin domain-containing protein 1-like [Branchiostoma floridae x Branchiostoma japonicum]
MEQPCSNMDAYFRVDDISRPCNALTAPPNGALSPPGPHFYPSAITITSRPCNALTAPANGALSPPGPYVYQSTVTIFCNSGYQLNGASTRPCPSLTAPTYGTLSPPGPAYSYPSTVTITCNTGYQLNGASSLTCQADGTWSNPVPICTGLVVCPMLTAPPNGALSPLGPYFYPNQVTVTCNTGYQLNGVSPVMCQANGTWSNPVPTCTPRTCPSLTAPTNGTLSPPGPAYSYPSTVTITCNTGYQLNGASSLTCQADGTWSNPVPICTVVCPMLTAPPNGALSPLGPYFYPTQVTVTCNPGYQLNGVSPVTCQANRTWSNPVGTCTLRQCPELAAPTNGARAPPTGGNSYLNVVFFTCNTGYVRNGPSATRCQADGSWSYPIPTCIPIQCPALTAPAFGLLSPIGVTAYLTVVNVICNTGYVLNGTDDTTCEADGTWSNPVPTCIPSIVSSCGNLTVFNSDSGSFTSPGWPGPYPLSTNCTWQINVSPGYMVLIRMDNFDLEHGGRTCIWDSLRIHDGPNISSPIIADLCGSSVRPVITTGRSAFVVFHSDESVTDSGFLANFTAWNDSLNALLPTTQPPEYRCEPIQFSRCQGTYNQTSFPNVFQWPSQIYTLYFAQLLFPQFDRIRDCHRDFDFFMCSIFFPGCTSEGQILPCQSFCNVFNAACGGRALALGLLWDSSICANLPTSDCAGPTGGLHLLMFHDI